MAELTQQELEAIWAASGRDPSQREQILASQSLLPTDYYVPNYMNYGGGYTTGQKPDVGLYPGKEYVLVDNRTGQTLASGSTPEDFANIRNIIETQLVPQGGKADWSLVDMGGSPTGATLNMHTTLPSGVGEAVKVGDAYGIPIAGDRPNNFFTDLFLPMIAPIAATAGAYFGGTALLGAGGGGGAGAGAAGAGLAEGASLAPGALASLPANLAAIQSGANAALAGAGLGTAAGIGAGTAALTGGASAAGSELPGLLVTATKAGSVVPVVAPLAAAATTAAATSGTSAANAASDAAISQNTQNAVDTAYTNAQTGAASDLAAAGYNGMGAGPFVAGGAGATVGGGVLGTGLTASQLYNIGSLGSAVIGGLLGGGGGSGGAGTGTPYVSPFGAGPAIGGADFRVNPNIKNYEQYGFGGEATFFRPEYNKLVSSGASMGGAPIGGTATTNTPTYTPLIGGTTTGGTTTGGTTTTGGATTGGTTAVTKQERPAGFTGVVSGQQVGDTQVVDGTTWAYGGDKAGWQMQYKDPTTGNLALLPGNGATNVSSFANNPTVAVNQPYFEQNTANIPGWATTYHGFQQGLMGAGVTGDRKAAAERELFTALETQPFANATALVDYAKGIYNKYTSPSLI